MTDQTPITRAELDALIAAAVARTLAMTPEERSAMMEAQRQSWVRGEAELRRDTEPSASPPRVPGASAQAMGEGIESGPGQPMANATAQRLREISGLFMTGTALEIDLSAGAMLIDALDAEIRRLRDQTKTLNAALTTMTRAGKSAREEGRRAGIEEAFAAAAASTTSEDARGYGAVAKDAAYEYAGRVKAAALAAIRALADKPAPDPRLAGLEYVRREWFKIRTTGATLAEWLDVQIAARTAHKGGDNS